MTALTQELFHSHISKKFQECFSGKLLLAVSGGLDSMVLLHLVSTINPNFGAAHCNYQLRGKESDEDECFVKKKSKLYGATFYNRQWDTKKYASTNRLSIQEAARELRYSWFEKIRTTGQYDWILTAHHLDDQLETFLIHLSRGTGIKGLLGIPERNKNIIRPLLPFSKKDIRKFALSNQIEWREDSSNKKNDYLRNQIRNCVVPELKKANDQLLPNVQNTIFHLQQTYQINQSIINQVKSEIFKKEYPITIPLNRLKGLSPVDGWLFELFSPYGFSNVKDLKRLLNVSSGKYLESRTHTIWNDRNQWILERKEHDKEKETLIHDMGEIDDPIRLRFIESNRISKEKNRISVDANQLIFPLKLRTWKAGDFFFPIGMKGKKKLSDYFTDHKFTRAEKRKQLLLVNGDKKIIWIVNHRMDDQFKVTPKTKKKFDIQYIP